MKNNETGTRSFVFMPSYLDTVKKMKNDSDRLSFFMALAEYGITGNLVEINEIVDIAMTAIVPIIDEGKINYETSKANGKKGGRPTTSPIDDIRKMKKQGRTQAEIARELKVSISTVRKYWDFKDDTTDNQCIGDGDADVDEDNNINMDEDVYKDMGVIGSSKRLITDNNSFQQFEQPSKPQPITFMDRDDVKAMASTLADIFGSQHKNEIVRLITDRCTSQNIAVRDFKAAFNTTIEEIKNEYGEQQNISFNTIRDKVNSIAWWARAQVDHTKKAIAKKDDFQSCLDDWQARI